STHRRAEGEYLRSEHRRFTVIVGAADDRGLSARHASAQPADGEFLDGVEKALVQLADTDALGGVERRFLAHRVADPYPQRADRRAFLHRRLHRPAIDDARDQPVAIGP